MMVVMKETPPAADSPPRSSTGKLLVVGIFVVALTAAGFALWWNISRSREALAFWGKDGVRLIQYGGHVELLTLNSLADFGPPGFSPAAPDQLNYGGQRIRVVKNYDLSKARGLVHARHSLTDDSSFEWPSAEKGNERNWTHALRFRDAGKTGADKTGDGGEVLILLDLPSRRLANFAAEREVTVIPKISEGWQTFIAKHSGEKK